MPKKRVGGDDLAHLRALERDAAAKMALEREELDELLAIIRSRRARIAEDFYDIALALAQIERGKLYAADDCASVSQLVEKHDLFSAETARKLVALVAAPVSRRDAVALGGFERAFAATRLAKALGKTVRALIEEGVSVGGSPIVEASVAEIEASTAKVTRSARGRGHPLGLGAALGAAEVEAGALLQALSARGMGAAEAKVARRLGGVRVILEMPSETATKLRETLVADAPRARSRRSQASGKRTQTSGKPTKTSGKR